MMSLIPTAPPIEYYEEMESYSNYSQINQFPIEDTSGDTTKQDFKTTYLMHEPVFRTLEQSSCMEKSLLDNMLNINCNNSTGTGIRMYQLAVWEKIFQCHVFRGDKHAAILVIEKITKYIEQYFAPTLNEIFSLAEILTENNMSLHSALIYIQITTVLAQRRVMGNETRLPCIQKSTLRLKRLVDKFEAFGCKENKVIITNYIIPLMLDQILLIQYQVDVDEKIKAKCLSWSKYFVAMSFLKTGNLIEMKEKTKEAIVCMESVFKEEASKHWLYGLCYHYHAYALSKMENYKEAAEHLEKALLYRTAAEDCPTPEEKQKKIDLTSSLLKQVKSKCN